MAREKQAEPPKAPPEKAAGADSPFVQPKMQVITGSGGIRDKPKGTGKA